MRAGHHAQRGARRADQRGGQVEAQRLRRGIERGEAVVVVAQGLAQADDVALDQGAAVQAAEAPAQIGAFAAHHGLDGVAAVHGQVGARAASGRGARGKGEQVAGAGQLRAQHGHGGAVQGGAQVRARQCEAGRRLEAQHRSDQGDLQRGAARRVADQQAGEPMGALVHGAVHGDALVLVAGAAQILERRLQAGLEDGDAHQPFPFILSKALRLTALKCTRSPGASSTAGERLGSNSSSGVAPMMLQPPGSPPG